MLSHRSTLRSIPADPRFLADLEIVRTVKAAEYPNEGRNQSGPAGLMARADARPVVAVEVLVELQVVAPVRIGLERLRAAIHWALAAFVAQEDAREAVGDLASDFEQVHQLARAGRTFDLERVAVVQIEIQQRADQQRV